MVTFKVPALPQSVNSLYKYNFRHRTVYLSNEGRTFKNLVKQYMPPMKYEECTLFSVSMSFHGNWLFKNGKNKRADVQNLIKILIDAIFEKIGIDDSYVYSLNAYKIQDEETYTHVTLETL